jgi:glycosyltransferase involved in cell wall biosynthesis
LVTYNHGAYIRQALDSLFGQQLDIPIELVVADDKSSDNTLDIVKEYEARDDRFKFKFLSSQHNLGITKNYQRGFLACSGKYIAVLEGDDYWVSPFKLSKQMKFLDEHWEVDLCAVNYLVYEQESSRFYPRTVNKDEYRHLGARELIDDNLVGNFSTCMYRNAAISKLPANLFELTSYDWIINICIARTSLIGFLNDPMSVYRIHSTGEWSQSTLIDKLKIQLSLIPEYDKLTGHVFTDQFNKLVYRLERQLNELVIVDSKLIKYIPKFMVDFLHWLSVTFPFISKSIVFTIRILQLRKKPGKNFK